MTPGDLDAEIDEFAHEVEQTIDETESFLAGLPEFRERTYNAKELDRALGRSKR